MLAGAAAAFPSFGPGAPALAAGRCEALLLNCVDYRLQDATGLRND